MPTLVIITGCPGTGKSYLANLLLQRFPSLQLKSYDTLKEEFWDRYGFQDPEEKRRNTACSLQQYYADLARLMLLKTDLLIEYPFHLGHKAVLSQLIQTYAYTAVTILMHGQMDVIYTRSIQRDSSGHRHPGHLLNRYHLGDTAEDSDAQRSLTYEEFLARQTAPGSSQPPALIYQGQALELGSEALMLQGGLYLSPQALAQALGWSAAQDGGVLVLSQQGRRATVQSGRRCQVNGVTLLQTAPPLELDGGFFLSLDDLCAALGLSARETQAGVELTSLSGDSPILA